MQILVVFYKSSMVKLFFIVAQTDTNKLIKVTTSSNVSIWFWVSLVELLLIIYLFFKLKRKRSVLDFSDLTKANLKTDSVNMTDLMDNINKSKDLYKVLSRKCHPDKFIDSNYHSIADDIFQEITINKRNFKKLDELKERAIKELNVKF